MEEKSPGNIRIVWEGKRKEEMRGRGRGKEMKGERI